MRCCCCDAVLLLGCDAVRLKHALPVKIMTAKLEPRHGAWKFIREGQGRGDGLGHTRHSATDGG